MKKQKFFLFFLWEGVMKHRGGKWDILGVACDCGDEVLDLQRVTKLYHTKVKIDNRICERWQTNVIMWTHFKWPFFFHVDEGSYMTGDEGDTGVQVVMTNYSSSHTPTRISNKQMATKTKTVSHKDDNNKKKKSS